MSEKVKEKDDFIIEMLEDYKWVKKGETINCFMENSKEYLFEFAGEDDTDVWSVPKDKAKKISYDEFLKKENEKQALEKKYWVNIMVCEMHDWMPHEILTAKLRAKKPFTKIMIDDFIKGETTINNIKKVAEAHDQELKIMYVITNNT